MLPPTMDRVRRHTSEHVNRGIDSETEARVRSLTGNPDGIERRLAELEREWDIERALETNAAGIGLAGLALGAFYDRRFLLLPTAVCGFLLQHALQGWCPPIELFRRLGVRTTAEIDRERTALKALRGDFARAQHSPVEALAATVH